MVAHLENPGRLVGLALCAWALAGSASAQAVNEPTQLTEARRLYNLGRYEAAISAAEQVAEQGAFRNPAVLVLGRARLERYRQTAEAEELREARDELRSVDASRLDARDRLELVVGLGQALYLDSYFRAAAEVFSGALDNAGMLGPGARDQLLDWWATALERDAQTRLPAERAAFYDRIVTQMEQELKKDAGAASASYWLASALRLRGDLDRAWDAALAGWVRGQLARDRGAALRPDLDQLMRDGIIPDRARKLAIGGQDAEQVATSLTTEWDQFKEKWAR
jgi:tetratricopeptide (TPR) repeat protein